MKLRIRVPAEDTVQPDDEELLAAAHAAAAQRASAWTTPVYVSYTDGAHVFEVDAQPRMPGVSTANVAPALLPPRVP